MIDMDIEQIDEAFRSIAPSADGKWSIRTLIAERLHLSMSPERTPALFIEGDKASFGPLPPISSVDHSNSVTSLPSGREFRALRITANDQQNSRRALAHIAYELVWRLEQIPSPNNLDLLKEVRWLFPLLGGQRLPMSRERQLGFIGETLFLRRLLNRAHQHRIDVKHALQSWMGFEPAKRDFYREGTAVEVKSTGLQARLHHIGSIDQLTPQQQNEAVYLFSVGIRSDPSAPKRLPNFVLDIEALLVDQDGNPNHGALDMFRSQAATYGFAWSDQDLYERENGFLAPHLFPELFDTDDLNCLQLSHFVDGKIPETVRSISYVLEVAGTPLQASTANQVLDALLGMGS
jgi:hypothetical protein